MDNTGDLWPEPLRPPPKGTVGEAPVLSFLPPARPGMGFIRELSWVMGRFVRLGPEPAPLVRVPIMRILSYGASQFRHVGDELWSAPLCG